MPKLILWTLSLLLLTACTLSPYTEEQVRLLELDAGAAEAEAEAAETNEEKLAALERVKALREEIDRLKAEDYGRQSGYVWELALAALGLGGVGAARTFGKSRASVEIARLQQRIEDFERGFSQAPGFPAPPASPGLTVEERQLLETLRDQQKAQAWLAENPPPAA